MVIVSVMEMAMRLNPYRGTAFPAERVPTFGFWRGRSGKWEGSCQTCPDDPQARAAGLAFGKWAGRERTGSNICGGVPGGAFAAPRGSEPGPKLTTRRDTPPARG